MSQFSPRFIQKAMLQTAMLHTKQYLVAMHDAGRLTDELINTALHPLFDAPGYQHAIVRQVVCGTEASQQERKEVLAALEAAGAFES
jgi:hypothetical protein